MGLIPSIGWFGYIGIDTLIFEGMVGQPFFAGFSVVGGTPPYRLTMSPIPAGLNFDPSLLLVDQQFVNPALNPWIYCVTGIPQTAGTTVFNVTITDSIGSVSSPNNNTIHISPVQYGEMGLPVGHVNNAYAFQFDNNFASSAFSFFGVPNPVPPYTYSDMAWLIQGNPGGFTLSSAGLLAGTPILGSINDGHIPPHAGTTRIVLSELTFQIADSQSNLAFPDIQFYITPYVAPSPGASAVNAGGRRRLNCDVKIPEHTDCGEIGRALGPRMVVPEVRMPVRRGKGGRW